MHFDLQGFPIYRKDQTDGLRGRVLYPIKNLVTFDGSIETVGATFEHKEIFMRLIPNTPINPDNFYNFLTMKTLVRGD